MPKFEPVKRAILYARVSKGEDQDPETQLQALRSWAASRGWPVVVEKYDEITGDPKRRKTMPPGLAEALRTLRAKEADVLAIWSLERVVRSMRQLMNIFYEVERAGAELISQQQTQLEELRGPFRDFMIAAHGLFAELELELIRSRTNAGLARARAAGRIGGRPRAQLPELGEVVELWRHGRGVRLIAAELNTKVWRIRQAPRELRKEGLPPAGEGHGQVCEKRCMKRPM